MGIYSCGECDFQGQYYGADMKNNTKKLPWGVKNDASLL